MKNSQLLRSVLVAATLATSLAGCAAMSGRETAGEYVDDTTIAKARIPKIRFIVMGAASPLIGR